MNTILFDYVNINQIKKHTSKKYPNTEFFLVCIFLYSNWIRRFTPYISVFSPNPGIYGPKKKGDLNNFHVVITTRKYQSSIIHELWEKNVNNARTKFRFPSYKLYKATKFYIKDFFRKCDQIRRKLQIWSNLLKKSLTENFIFVQHVSCRAFQQSSTALSRYQS